MKLHIVTAVSRPENIQAMADSIYGSHAPGVELNWHMAYSEHPCPGGQWLKNKMLDEINSGWVVFLDDDTLMHHSFQKTVVGMDDEETNAIVFGQRRNGGEVGPSLGIGQIDSGQALIRREAIGDRRIPERYDGDGEFLTDLFTGMKGVVFLPEVLSIYNALR